MNHAVIAQHYGATPTIIAQTLWVPIDGKLIEFARLNAHHRGSSGAWNQVESRARNVAILGQPVSVALTENDLRDFDLWLAGKGTPDTLFQKSVRKVRDFTTPTHQSLQEVHDEVTRLFNAGESLGGFKRTKARVIAEAPAVTVEAQPAPVQQAPTQTIPAPVVQAPAVNVPAGVGPQLFVPSATEVKGYQPRTKLYGELDETLVFDRARASQQHVSIVGHAGTGKTSSVRHYAHLRNLPFVAVECDIALDETQTEGSYVPTGNGNEVVWSYSALATAIQQPSVVLLNELSRLAPKNASLFLGLLQERKLIIGQRHGEVIDVHPDCLIVADMNPQGYSGVSVQDEALMDRFHIAVEYEYDLAIDRIWCKSETFLKEVVAKYRETAKADPTLTPFSHRLVRNFQWQVDNFGLAPACKMLVQRFSPESRECLRTMLDSNLVNIASELGQQYTPITFE